jgi:mono/diheme cytochrome c family protein
MFPRRCAALLAILAVTPVLAACGGDDNNDGGGGTATTGTQTQQTQTQEQASADGKAIFTQNCAGCHTLSAAGSNGQAGPNLDDLEPDQATVEAQVRNGGGNMPAFEGKLSNAEIQAVADFVSGNAGS